MGVQLVRRLIRKPKKPNGKKLGTYSPTDAVAQPLGVKGKKSIDR